MLSTAFAESALLKEREKKRKEEHDKTSRYKQKTTTKEQWKWQAQYSQSHVTPDMPKYFLVRTRKERETCAGRCILQKGAEIRDDARKVITCWQARGRSGGPQRLACRRREMSAGVVQRGRGLFFFSYLNVRKVNRNEMVMTHLAFS